MTKYKFFVVSKDGSFLMDSKDFSDGIDQSKQLVDVDLFINQKNESICKLYNYAISQSLSYDYIVLMHADVKLNVKDLIDHVEAVAGKYDVIGLCGCDKMSIGQTPLNWYTGSNQYADHRWGCVTHGEIGNQTSFFNGNKEDTDHEVACIDGLCIILTNKAANVLKFDEQFKFSHYDTDISFQCVFNYKLKLGVIVRTDLQHNSVGKSILTPEFLESEKIFRSKWKNLTSVK